MQFASLHGSDINATANITILRKTNAKKRSGGFHPLANIFKSIKGSKIINKEHRKKYKYNISII